MLGRWYYRQQGQHFGPIADLQLKHLAISGQLRPTDSVQREGSDQWVAAGSVAGLFPATNSKLPVPTPMETQASLPETPPDLPLEDDADMPPPMPSAEDCDLPPPLPADADTDLPPSLPAEDDSEAPPPLPSDEESDIPPPFPPEDISDAPPPLPPADESDTPPPMPADDEPGTSFSVQSNEPATPHTWSGESASTALVETKVSAKTALRRPKKTSTNPTIAIGIAIVMVGCIVAAVCIFMFGGTQPPAISSDDKALADKSPAKMSKGSADTRTEASDKTLTAKAVKKKESPDASATKPKSDTIPLTEKPPIEVQRKEEVESLSKAEEHFTKVLAAARTPAEFQAGAKQGLTLVDRAIVEGNSELAKKTVIQSLAAARDADALALTKRATLLYIQLQTPISASLTENARKRLTGPVVEDRETRSSVTEAQFGPAVPSPSGLTAEHGVRCGKTEDERKKIFYDLLKAVDDQGMTPEGRKAWKGILRINGIDAAAALSILDEGFSGFSAWDQPGGNGTASSRINRIEWIGCRTRTRTEPMLKE